MTLFDPEPQEEAPDAPLPVREPERLGSGVPSPWQGVEHVWPGGVHDERTCPTCAPYVDHPAYAAGVARAGRGATFGGESPQPLSPPPAGPRPALRFPLDG